MFGNGVPILIWSHSQFLETSKSRVSSLAPHISSQPRLPLSHSADLPPICHLVCHFGMDSWASLGCFMVVLSNMFPCVSRVILWHSVANAFCEWTCRRQCSRPGQWDCNLSAGQHRFGFPHISQVKAMVSCVFCSLWSIPKSCFLWCIYVPLQSEQGVVTHFVWFFWTCLNHLHLIPRCLGLSNLFCPTRFRMVIPDKNIYIYTYNIYIYIYIQNIYNMYIYIYTKYIQYIG